MSPISAPVLLGQPGSRTPDDLRQGYIDTLAKHPVPAGVAFERIDMGGVPGTLATPEIVKGDAVLFYIHGGAYIIGAPESLRAFAAALKKKLRNGDGTFARDQVRTVAQRVDVVDRQEVRIRGLRSELLRTPTPLWRRGGGARRSRF